ncbi:cellulase family glycosylhydrolase [Teredinibacter franksiae]|uniref:cellulase family glycosylhydrolase n=1 Tax=Teredinibacter franksiae TaxID=2761453 RepID=UPI00162A0FC5|nr:cellulase family glycosylhydrolase [Teredinibacter franksiae]
MKLRLSYLALTIGAVLLSGCGGGLAGGSDDDLDPLSPIIEEEISLDGPRPPEGAAVITSEGPSLLDVSGKPILMRGVNLQYGDNPEAAMAGIEPIANIGSNVVRVLLTEATTAGELQASLDVIVANDMIALLTLDSAEKLACMDDDSFFYEATNELWLDRWLPILAEAKYQAHLMFNIANEWGPINIWNSNSIGYDEYIDAYKIAIRRFRSAGFQVPLVIDAPHCGEDYNAFLGGRGRELMAADEANNIVLSVHAFGSRWDSSGELSAAIEKLSFESLPLVITEFSDANIDEGAIDHEDLMKRALGGKSLLLRMPWETTADTAGYAYTFEPPVDFSEGSGINFEINVPNNYRVDGNLAYQVFLIDDQGRYGALGFNSVADLQANAWNDVSIVAKSESDFGYIEAGFDLTRVEQLGFEVTANGKPADIQGDIKFDNLIVGVADTGGDTTTAVYQENFDDGLQGWGHNNGAGDASSVQNTNGELTLLAPWVSGNSSSQIGFPNLDTLSPAIDITQPLNLTVDVFIPAEYANETGLNIQFIFNGNDWKGFAGFGYTSYNGFTFGEWNTLTVKITNFAADAGYISSDFPLDAPPVLAGLQIGGIAVSPKTEPLRFDNFRITPEEPQAEAETIYEATFTFDEEWSYLLGAGDDTSVYQYNDALAILAPWDADNTGTTVNYDAAASLSPAINLQSPFAISVDVWIPQEYDSESSMNMQFFFSPNNYDGFAGFGYTQASNLTLGAWNTLTVNIANFAQDAGYISDGFILDKPPQRVGFQVGGITSGKSEPILIDNFRITAEGRPSVPENIVLDLNFEEQSQVDTFALSYFNSPAWMESSLVDSKLMGDGAQAYGWIAWSWFGNPSPNEGLNISLSEDTAILTERGEEITNGEYGIEATAEDVSFQ